MKENRRYPQCRCARFGQSRFEPVQRTTIDGKVWWCIVDHLTGMYICGKFKKRRQALVHLAIELWNRRLPYEPDPGFGKAWLVKRSFKELAWLVDHRKLKEDKSEID